MASGKVTSSGEQQKKIALVQKETSPKELFQYLIELLDTYPHHQFMAILQRKQLADLLENLPLGHVVLTDILNTSIRLGTYPSKLKMAKIIPVFKGDDDTDTNNYRPISLLSNFNRVFEKIIYKRLTSYIDKHDLLNSSQYGFRQGHSTQHAILDIVNDIQSNMNQRLLSCGVFIDLKKAFDTIDLDVLLDKLNHYGFRGIINSWFSSYLKNRTQTTQVDRHISDKAVVGCGVPQGSVLGPLLFLLYVNDIHRCSNKLRFYLFADDTNILYADKNLKDLETTVNNELQNLYNWLTANKLTLNIKKSNFVISHPYQKRLDQFLFLGNRARYGSLEHEVYLELDPLQASSIFLFQARHPLRARVTSAFPQSSSVSIYRARVQIELGFYLSRHASSVFIYRSSANRARIGRCRAR